MKDTRVGIIEDEQAEQFHRQRVASIMEIASAFGVPLPMIRAKKPYNKGAGLQPWTGTPAPTKAALAAARAKGREKRGKHHG